MWLKGTDRGERSRALASLGSHRQGPRWPLWGAAQTPLQDGDVPPNSAGPAQPRAAVATVPALLPALLPSLPPPQVLTPWALPWECPACPSPSPRTRPATGLRVGSPKSREEERKGSKLKRTALSQTLQNGVPLMKGSDPTPLDGIHPRPNTIVSKGFP